VEYLPHDENPMTDDPNHDFVRIVSHRVFIVRQ